MRIRPALPVLCALLVAPGCAATGVATGSTSSVLVSSSASLTTESPTHHATFSLGASRTTASTEVSSVVDLPTPVDAVFERAPDPLPEVISASAATSIAMSNGLESFRYAGEPITGLVTWSSPDLEHPRKNADHRLVWVVAYPDVFMEDLGGIRASDEPGYARGSVVVLVDAVTGEPIEQSIQTLPVVCATVSPPNEHCPMAVPTSSN